MHHLYSNIILDTLRKSLAMEAERTLVYDHNGRTLRGTEVLQAIDTIALELINTGIQHGDRVIFLVRPSIESVLYFYALIRAGAVAILVDPEMGQENFISRIEFSKADWIIQDPILEKIEKYSFIKPLLRFFNIWFPDKLPIESNKRITVKNVDLILKQQVPDSIQEKIVSADEDMIVIFTSGGCALLPVAPRGAGYNKY